MAAKYFIGIDIGGTKMAAGLVTWNGRILLRRKVKTPSNPSKKVFLAAVINLVRELVAEGDLTIKDIAGIGIGIPGVIDPVHGKVLLITNLPLSGINLAAELRKTFKLHITVGNDANIAALGEHRSGLGKNAENIVNISVGTGVGGGFIINGKLVTGAFFAGGELGHMIVQMDGPKCTCGKKGCLEAFAGRWAIEKAIRAGIAKGEKTVITKYTQGKLKSIKSKTLRKALDNHDPLVTRVIKEAAKALGEACVSIMHIIDPEYIILGGGVIEACGDYMMPLIRKAAESDAFLSSVSGCIIAKSSLGDDSIILGAAAAASQPR